MGAEELSARFPDAASAGVHNEVTRTMQRRKFIAGVGSLAAAGAAGIGTGAFSAMSAGRGADINVTADDDGLVALKVGSGADGRVAQTENGELEIDFTSEQGGQGVNVNSRYQVGTPGGLGWATQQAVDEGFMNVPLGDPVGPDEAFTVVNQDTASHDVTLEFETDQNDIGGAEVFFYFVPGVGGQSQSGKSLKEATGTGNSLSYTADCSPGTGIAVCILVDTRDYNGDPDDLDLSGTLTVSAV